MSVPLSVALLVTLLTLLTPTTYVLLVSNKGRNDKGKGFRFGFRFRNNNNSNNNNNRDEDEDEGKRGDGRGREPEGEGGGRRRSRSASEGEEGEDEEEKQLKHLFVSGLLVVYLSKDSHLLLVNLGATFISSLFAEVFMISAFVAFANPTQGEGKGRLTTTSRGGRSIPYAVLVLGTFMSILGGVLVSLIEFLPDETSKLVYTFLAAVSILIGVTKTHGLGGWVMHRTRRRNRSGFALSPTLPRKGSGGLSVSEQFDSNWSFWQPGRGGTVFIITQVCGWCFFATSLLGLAWISKFAVNKIKSLRSVTLPTAAVMIAAQLALAGSLTFFKDSGEDSTTFPKNLSASFRLKALGKGKESWLKVAEDSLTIFLFYCPHYIVISAFLIPYLFLPVAYASSIMMGVYLPLHLMGSIGNPQLTGNRESPAFRDWVGRSFARISDRFMGGIRFVCELKPLEERGTGKAGGAGEEKYIFAYHPHALYPLGLVTFHLLPHFARYFSVRPVTLVASVIFRLPFMRDLACLGGLREVTSTSFRRALRERNAVALVPGGQAEICVAPRAHSVTNPEIVLNTRHKGFIKIALESGASIVPVLCFGEIYQLKNGISLPRLQAWTYKQFGFPIPFLPVGRFGMPIPLANEGGRPITFVVGEPLKVPKLKDGAPVREAVEATHKLYYSKVADLYEKHKEAAGYQGKRLVLEHK
ncbi:diacylglycerol acyltransferase [Chloropicon primus]|uniref:Diacylglycerol acyltransferase n=1 Tax=Chloropicon primus TaxID=1764295 RepID=A0A5B8MD30_9CHLO|nr:diacylglycerol acyltransferase [Chloropicon primus]|eukprot:QDZ18478.1 diacylglycerol acyltransferase [Chloropicon primus]